MRWILIFYLISIILIVCVLNCIDVKEGLSTSELADYPKIYGEKYIQEVSGNTFINGQYIR